MITHDFNRCPRCGAPTEKATALNKGPSEFWYSCIKCNTYINTYQPQKHQHRVHQDPTRFLANFGGYGLTTGSYKTALIAGTP